VNTWCDCGHPLWAPERGFCEWCRLHHCVYLWPATGYRPRALPYLLPDDPYENPFHKTDEQPAPGTRLVRTRDGTMIHRGGCAHLGDKSVPWLWADGVSYGEICYAVAYFGYQTCGHCHPLTI
jgi:hypothetical protein